MKQEIPQPTRKKRGGRKLGSKNKPKLISVEVVEAPKKKRGRPFGSKNKPKLLPSDFPAHPLESNPTLLFGGAVQEKPENDTLLSAQIYRDLKISLPEQGERRPITARDTFLGGEMPQQPVCSSLDYQPIRQGRGKDRQPRKRSCFKRALQVPQSANNITEGAQKNAQ